MNSTTSKTRANTLLALLDADAPAKVERPPLKWSSEPSVSRAKMTRHTITREPDIFDEVEGEALWFADGFAVVVPLERLDDFRAYIACRGLSTIGRGAYELQMLVTANVTWDRVFEAVKAAA